MWSLREDGPGKNQSSHISKIRLTALDILSSSRPSESRFKEAIAGMIPSIPHYLNQSTAKRSVTV